MKKFMMNAKVLAAVALAGCMFVSCEEDEDQSVDMGDFVRDAYVVVKANTVDTETNQNIDATYNMPMPYQVTPNADGTVSAQTLSITAEAAGYYSSTKSVEIPGANKGEVVYVPVTFYTSQTASDVVVEEPTIVEDENGQPIVEAEVAAPVEVETFQENKENEIAVEVNTGLRLKDYEAVVEDINGLSFADGRALTESEIMIRVKEALKNLANSLKEFKKEADTVTAFIPANTAKVETKIKTNTVLKKTTLSTTQEGKTWSIEVEVEEVTSVNVEVICTDETGHHNGGNGGK